MMTRGREKAHLVQMANCTWIWPMVTVSFIWLRTLFPRRKWCMPVRWGRLEGLG